jgi:uncharacterized phiE125 gp8 family phage protein
VILSCTGPAESLPFDMSLLRLHCRIDEDDNSYDSILELYARAAIRQGEFETNRVWQNSRWTGKLNSFPTGAIMIPKSPCTGVSSIVYVATGGTEMDFSEFFFFPSSLEWGGGMPYAEVRPESGWPQGTDVTVTFQAGWPDDEFPSDMAQWLLVKVAGKFEQREDLASATRKIAIPFPRHFVDSLLDAWYLPR